MWKERRGNLSSTLKWKERNIILLINECYNAKKSQLKLSFGVLLGLDAFDDLVAGG